MGEVVEWVGVQQEWGGKEQPGYQQNDDAVCLMGGL